MGRRFWVAITWTLFVAWVGWLGWQAHRSGRFPVVSRAQFLAADLAILADVQAEPDRPAEPIVKVVSTVWPTHSSELKGQDLLLSNLPGCDGFATAGRYVIPLSKEAAGGFRVAVAPPSPLAAPGRPLIYPDRMEVFAQLREIRPAVK